MRGIISRIQASMTVVMLSRSNNNTVSLSEAQLSSLRNTWEELMAEPPSSHAETAIALARRIREFEESVHNDPNALVKSRNYKPRGLFR